MRAVIAAAIAILLLAGVTVAQVRSDQGVAAGDASVEGGDRRLGLLEDAGARGEAGEAEPPAEPEPPADPGAEPEPPAEPEAVPEPAPAPQPQPQPQPPAQAAAPPPGVHSPPGHIAADCSRDETDALNAWLASVPDDATVRLAAGGCYRAERTVQVSGKSGWTIDGNGATLRRAEVSGQAFRYPKSNAHLRLVDAPGVTVRDLVVVGTNDGRDLGGVVIDADGAERKVQCYTEYGFTCYTVALEFEHGIDLRGAPGATVSGVTVDAVWGDGVYVSGGDQFADFGSDGAVIRGVSISRNGRQGIAVVRSSDVLIDRAHIKSSRRAGIDLEPDSSGEVIRNIEIRDSTIHSWLLAFASAGRGTVSDVWIHDNTVTRSGVPFVYVRASDGSRRANWRIHDNVVTYGLGSPQPAMLFERVDNVSVLRNTVAISPAQSRWFVGFTDTGGTLEVKHNDVRDATTDKLYTVNGMSRAPGVQACGNTTADGANQPVACVP